jgi:flagellum-specific peptidoglycan hydrolase FlgJ
MATGVFPPEVIAGACASQARWDVPASVCLAQWALESGWGRAMPPRSNNPFGIKAGPRDPAVVAVTREVIDGRSVRLPQRFRKYPTVAAAFADHGRLLATGDAYAEARRVRRDGRAFAQALEGHYATDPLYAAHLLALIDAHDLLRFDRAPDAAV